MDEVGEDKPEETPVKTVTEEAVTAVRRSGRENAGKNGAALQLARAQLAEFGRCQMISGVW